MRQPHSTSLHIPPLYLYCPLTISVQFQLSQLKLLLNRILVIFHQLPYHILPIRPYSASIEYTKSHAHACQSHLLSFYVYISRYLIWFKYNLEKAESLRSDSFSKLGNNNLIFNTELFQFPPPDLQPPLQYLPLISFSTSANFYQTISAPHVFSKPSLQSLPTLTSSIPKYFKFST